MTSASDISVLNDNSITNKSYSRFSNNRLFTTVSVNKRFAVAKADQWCLLPSRKAHLFYDTKNVFTKGTVENTSLKRISLLDIITI